MKKSFLQTIAIVMAIVTMLSTALSLSAGAATTKFLDTDNKYVYITNFSDQDKRLIEKKQPKIIQTADLLATIVSLLLISLS